MDDLSKDHFDRISSRYRAAAERWRPIYEQAESLLAPLVRDRDVLDIGNGGVFAYDVSTTRSTTVVDISPEMLAGLSAPNLRTVVADARDLASLGEASFDVAVLMLVLHHVNGRTYRETKLQIGQVVRSVVGRLVPGGHLVVVEPVIRPALRHLQRAAFPVLRRLLSLAGVPMIHFHARHELAELLAEEATEVEVQPLLVEESIDPFGATFPGLISLPPRFRPTDYVLFHARCRVGGRDCSTKGSC